LQYSTHANAYKKMLPFIRCDAFHIDGKVVLVRYVIGS
jgi:hypothetical protein